MTDFAGLIHFNGKPVADKEVDELKQAISYGTIDSCAGWNDGPCGMASTFYRITAEDDYEAQPLESGDRRLVLVASARLDNRADLARQLELTLAEAKTTSDSSMILQAYQKWGEQCPDYLLGDFSFAVWDKVSRKLFCARDQLGKRVLYYCDGPNFLAFASTLRGLASLKHVPKRLNEQKLADFLVCLYADRQATFFHDIKALPSGHVLAANARRLNLRRYWQLDHRDKLLLKSDTAYKERFLSIFHEAVEARLRSDYPIAAQLSGGMDSSSVAMVAANLLQQRKQKLTTFSAVPGPGFKSAPPAGMIDDETPYIEAVGAHADNIDLNYVTKHRETLHGVMMDTPRMHYMPARNPENFIWLNEIHRLSGLSNHRVILTGRAGNVSMSYSGSRFGHELLRQGKWFALSRQLADRALHRRTGFWLELKGQVLGPLAPEWAWSIYRRLKHNNIEPWLTTCAIDPNFARSMRVRQRFSDLGLDPYYRRPVEGRKTRINTLLKEESTEFAAYDNNYRTLFGVEPRDPTADKRLVEFCLRIPESQYYRDGIDRLLIRRAMTGILPEKVRLRTEPGRQAANLVDYWQTSLPGVKQLFARLRSSGRAAQCLDLTRLGALLSAWPPSDLNSEDTRRDYVMVLSRGLAVGAFMLWFENEFE